MHEAKTHLSRLVDLALAGEEVVIARRDRPVVRLMPILETRKQRRIGSLPGIVKKLGEGFNESVEDWNDRLIPEANPEKPSGNTKS